MRIAPRIDGSRLSQTCFCCCRMSDASRLHETADSKPLLLYEKTALLSDAMRGGAERTACFVRAAWKTPGAFDKI